MQQSMAGNSILIVFSGLPGAGKSAVAERISQKLKIPVFGKDRIEAAMVRSELATIDNKRLGFSGYEILAELAEACLRSGTSLGLDSVCGFKRIRDSWHSLAVKYNAKFAAIECICSDADIHRTRLESRVRGIEGWHELDWAEVERVRSYFEPWDSEHLVVDSMNDIDENVAAIEGFINSLMAA